MNIRNMNNMTIILCYYKPTPTFITVIIHLLFYLFGRNLFRAIYGYK